MDEQDVRELLDYADLSGIVWVHVNG